MINKMKQRVILRLIEDGMLRVTEQGVVEGYAVGAKEWRPVHIYNRAKQYAPTCRRTLNGMSYEFPAAAASLLWRLRYVVSEDMALGYEDGNRLNLAPSNICLVTKAEAHGKRYNKDGTQKA